MDIKCLPWDSEFFGVTIAKTISPRLQPEEVKLVMRECERNAVRCLYCELDPAQSETVARVQEEGFRFIEMRTLLEHNLRRAADAASPARLVTPAAALVVDAGAQEGDAPYLESIAATLALQSRFTVDSHFGVEASRRLYGRWLHNSLQDSSITLFVARHEQEPVGFATLKPGVDAMQLELIGVAPQARGQGAGAQLVRSVVQAAAAAGASRLQVVTQGRNVAAVRLYERSGFRLERVSYYFHKWFN